jgi:hypothetical protein
VGRRATRNEGPGVQIRTTDAGAAIIVAVAKQERRSIKDQSEILVTAGAQALGYDLETLDLNDAQRR